METESLLSSLMPGRPADLQGCVLVLLFDSGSRVGSDGEIGCVCGVGVGGWEAPPTLDTNSLKHGALAGLVLPSSLTLLKTLRSQS